MERGPVMTPLDVHDQKRALRTNNFASLPEDVQLEIISHVSDIKDLFRFAVTCSQWVRRLTDPAFLRALSARTNRGRLIGFFFQKTRFRLCTTMATLRAAERGSVSAPTFLSSPWSLLGGPTERPLTAFVPDHHDDDGTFSYAEPLESRHGVVLMQLMPRGSSGGGGGGGGGNKLPVLLSLCDPITGECRFLPPLETPDPPPLWDRDFGVVGPEVTMTAAVITPAGAGSDNNNNLAGGGLLQHLLVGTKGSEEEQVYLHSYSAGTRSWSAPTRLLELEVSHHSTVLDRPAVVHGGAAHWLCTGGRKQRGDEDLYKLSVEMGTNTTRTSMTKLPFRFRVRGSPLLCVNKDGKLSAICIYVMHVTIWTQQERRKEGNGNGAPARADARWHRTAVIRIAPHPNYLPDHRDAYRWSGSRDGSLLVLSKLDVLQRSTRIFMVDLEKKKQMEVVKDISLPYEYKSNDLTVVPYEMDLEKFFMLRLHNAAGTGTKPAS